MRGSDTEAKFFVPDWLWHKVVVPARRATWAGGPVRQPYAMVDNIPKSGTKNFASELLVKEF